MTVPFTRTSSSRSEDSSPVVRLAPACSTTKRHRATRLEKVQTLACSLQAGAYVDRSPLRRSIDEESHDRLFLDDEELQLTEGTAAALAQFQQEKDEADSKPDAHLFEEKWGMSQVLRPTIPGMGGYSTVIAAGLVASVFALTAAGLYRPAQQGLKQNLRYADCAPVLSPGLGARDRAVSGPAALD